MIFNRRLAVAAVALTFGLILTANVSAQDKATARS